MSIKTGKTVKVQQLECNRCHYQWYPRISREGKAQIPETCANKECKSRYWDKKRIYPIKEKAIKQ